jgi:hypothetical protein
MADFGFHNNGSNNNFKPKETENEKVNETTENTSSEVTSFSNLSNKDGTPNYEPEVREDRKKYAIGDILDQEITVTEVRIRKSKQDPNKEYMTLKFVDGNGEKSFVNTSSGTVRQQLEGKIIDQPFTCRIGKNRSKNGREYYQLY